MSAAKKKSKKKGAKKKAKKTPASMPVKATTLVFAGVRHDLDDFFRLTDVLTSEKRQHHPFIVITTAGLVAVEKSATKLATQYEPSAQVLCQWPGKFRSDFFHFTVEEFRLRYKAKAEATV